jgi:hypothetical protein
MNNYKFFIEGIEGHQFLKLHKYYLNQKDARKYVIDRLKYFGLKRPKGGWEKIAYSLDSKQAPTINLGKFESLVTEARKCGYLVEMDRIIDNKDSIFGGAMNMSSNSETFVVTPIFLNGNESETKLDGPSRFYSIEDELTNDIIYFRQMACKSSEEHTFELTSRFYRSYIFACISMIEAFVNRYILAFKTKADFPLNELEKTSRLENKIEIVYKYLSSKEFSSLNSTTEWVHFLNLKKLRNSIIHSNSPFLGIQIKEIAIHLNYAKFGIGGLMKLIRVNQKQPVLAFINRLTKLPTIEYVRD